MNKVWVVTIEEKGMNNYQDYYYPNISIFDEKENLHYAILKYIKNIDSKWGQEFEKHCINQKDVFDHIIKNGGFTVDYDSRQGIRIVEKQVNSFHNKLLEWPLLSKKEYEPLILEVAKYDDDEESSEEEKPIVKKTIVIKKLTITKKPTTPEKITISKPTTSIIKKPTTSIVKKSTETSKISSKCPIKFTEHIWKEVLDAWKCGQYLTIPDYAEDMKGFLWQTLYINFDASSTYKHIFTESNYGANFDTQTFASYMTNTKDAGFIIWNRAHNTKMVIPNYKWKSSTKVGAISTKGSGSESLNFAHLANFIREADPEQQKEF